MAAPAANNQWSFGGVASQILVTAKDAAVSKAKDIASDGISSAVQSAVDFGKFATGISNVTESYNKLNETTTWEFSEKRGVKKVKERELGYVERVRNASAELVIAPAKIVGLATVSYGGVCKVGTALGLTQPCSPFSFGGIAQASFDTVTGLASGTANLVVKAAPTMSNAAVWGFNNITVPVAKFAFEQVITNPINVTGMAVIGTLAYSASKDFKEAGESQGVEKVVRGAFGVGKVGLALIGTIGLVSR